MFYQVWHQPIVTIGGSHLINNIIELCGGQNLFKEVSSLAPQISIEAVLVRNPQVIIGSALGEQRSEWLKQWRKWPHLLAVRSQHMYFINPDLLHRHTTRILQGARQMCEFLDMARGNAKE